MRCDEARRVFSELYDEALSGAPLVTVTQHLASCPACRAEWANFRKAMQAVADLGTAEPSPGFAARVRRRLEAPSRWRRVLRWIFLPLHVKVPIQAAAVLLLAFAGLLLYQRSPELRRAIEPSQIPSPPVAREAPAPAPPPAGGEPARKEEGPAPQAETPKATQAEPAAPPMAAVPPPTQGALEAGRERGASSPPTGTSELWKTTLPSESPRGEGSSQDSRAKSAEPGIAPGPLQQYAPAPAPSGGAGAPAQPSAKSLAVPPSAPRPSAALAPTKEAQTSAPQAKPADVLYGTGLTELADGKFDRAVDSFRAFLARYPQDARVPDARLRLGEAYFGQGRYAEALQEYEAVAQQFPSGPQVPTALYLQAQVRLAQGDRSGCQLLREVADLYPQAPEAASARQVLAARCR
ncbi:MAG: tetratricopeptide repeat protein [Candidatus Methylomirabilota bacterium]